MAEEYNVTLGNDGKVVVMLSPACKVGKEEILALLRELGWDASNVVFVEPDQVGECGDLKKVPVIIPIDEAICDLPELNEAGRQCGNAGGHLIVLFGPGYSYEGLHPIADKYGTQCGWSADQLKDCISGEANPPRDAAGAPAERSEAREVKCKK